MGSRRVATRTDHQDFCTTEGWARRKSATGRRGTHHVNYSLALPDGRVLYTRISHPVDRTDYGPRIWSHILRDQLEVTSEEFWACVDDRTLPARGVPAPRPDSLPAEIVYTLVHRIGVPEDEVRSMSKDEALARLVRFYNEGR